jgi:hypothetical protein
MIAFRVQSPWIPIANSLEMDSPLLMASTITYYRMGLGKLLHATNIHLNIAYFISVMTKFTTALCEVHFKATILIFYYLKGSLDFAIHYEQRGDIVPVDFTNNDYLGDLDKCKSISNYLFNIGSGPTS